MAKCAVCEKNVHYGNNVSHSHRRSNHIWKSNIKRVNWGVVKGMILAWVFTFPGCGLLGFLMAKFFMMIF